MKYRFLLLLLALGLFAISQSVAQSKEARVVFFEHSLRWSNESSFPHYLQLPEVEQAVIRGVEDKLKKSFALATVSFNDKIAYRVIDGFGKSKIKWSRAGAQSGLEVAIASSISRETTGFGMLWNMEVQMREGTKVVYSKTIKRPLEPVTTSCYITPQRWLEADEFTAVFLQLTDEALGLQESSAAPIKVGSPERILRRIQEFVPLEESYTLSIAGAMMQEANASYLLSKDSIALETLIYTEGWNQTVSQNNIFGDLMTELFRSITGLNVHYDLRSKETRVGRLRNLEGENIRLRLDWLTETYTQPHILGESEIQFISSPIAGQFYDKENTYAEFIYYKHLNNQQQDKQSAFTLRGIRGDAKTHTITGWLHGRQFEVQYPEQEGYILVFLDGKAVAGLSLYNENPLSKRFGGTSISTNKKAISSSTFGFSKPNANAADAEQYTLYTSGISTQETKEAVKLLVMLFFSIGQSS